MWNLFFQEPTHPPHSEACVRACTSFFIIAFIPPHSFIGNLYNLEMAENIGELATVFDQSIKFLFRAESGEYVVPAFEMRGIRLRVLRAICELAASKGGEWSVARISNCLLGSHEILKEGHRWGDVVPEDTLNFAADPADRMSLIDMLKTHHKDASNPHPTLGICYDEVVGDQATIFVSFTYNTDFFLLVKTIEAFVEDNPEHASAYFWFDMLVNNQWAALEHDFEWWSSTFKEAIGKIGHTILVCTPWSDPEPLKRAWCLWEIYCTVNSGGNFDVAIGANSVNMFVQAIITDAGISMGGGGCGASIGGAPVVNKPRPLQDMLLILQHIDVEKSECYLAQDKANIFNAIREGVGFVQMNRIIIDKMRQWSTKLYEKALPNATHLLGFIQSFAKGEDFYQTEEGKRCQEMERMKDADVGV